VLSLDDLKRVRDAYGGSVNDVLAAIVASATGTAEGRTEVTVTVPFAVRSLSQPGQYDNQVEAADVQLPAIGATPIEHYRAVDPTPRRVARDNLAVGGRLLGRVAGPTSFALLALGSRGDDPVDGRRRASSTAPGPPKTGAVFSGHSVEAHALAPHPPSVALVRHVDLPRRQRQCGC